MVPYFREYYSDDGGHEYDIVKLNPTGKWKECTDRNGNTTMYIQHKGWLFKQWVHEDNIFFSKGSEKEQIFTCKKA